MIPRIEEARYLGGFSVHIRFSEAAQGDVDLAKGLYGEIFEPLRDQTLFGQVCVHPEFHTLCWPNGADFAPEFLYQKVQLPA